MIIANYNMTFFTIIRNTSIFVSYLSYYITCFSSILTLYKMTT